MLTSKQSYELFIRFLVKNIKGTPAQLPYLFVLLKRRPEPALYFKSLDLVHPLQDTAQVHEDETDEDHFQELGQAGLPEAIIPS